MSEIKEHQRETLMRYPKEKLVDHILMLENNFNNLQRSFDQQYKNCLQLVDDMKLVNDTYKDGKKLTGTLPKVWESRRVNLADFGDKDE